MIIDWNRTNMGNKVFHFKNSLRPFIEVTIPADDALFVDLDKMIAYTFDELEYEGLEFYMDETEEDLDFLGVDVDGKIEWVE